MNNKKRFAIVLCLAITIALSFWIVSRYPQLNEKELMVRTSSSISDTLVTWPKIKIKEDYSFAQKVAYSTVNWCWENRRGMAFGVLIAALLLTIFSYLRVRSRTSSYLNALYGLVLGAPLGLCVNCAAPVFKGVLRSRRIETAFAAMLSSPTMNIIVLTMVFTVFPFYMAVTKVLFTLAVIFVGVPLISKILGKKHLLRDFVKLDVIAEAELQLTASSPAVQESWINALIGALTDVSKNLVYMSITTIPLMLLAGFIGALLNHLIPTTSFIHGTGGVLTTIGVAVVGTLLPVPMAFDIILTNALYALGLPPHLVLVLLCTLGIYSVYSFFIVWSSASPKWAVSLFVLILFSGIGMGLAGNFLHNRFYIDRNFANYRAIKQELQIIPAEQASIESFKGPDFAPRAIAPPIKFDKLRDQGDVSVYRSAFLPKIKLGTTPFVKREGNEIGLIRGFRYEIRDYPDPFWLGRGTAAGDFDGDGWDDIAFGTNYGIALYKNRGGWFEAQEIPNQEIQKFRVYAVAFVDLNNDGWLDLFFTTFDHGNYVVLNHAGKFDWENLIHVPNGNGVLTVAPAFADLKGSGQLDILNGNMALGIVTGFHHYGQGRASSITYNDGLSFREETLGGDAGETMATLVSDFNHDGYPDIYLGHDYTFPDQIFLGGPNGFKEVKKVDGFVSSTPVYSMSADIADINNDGFADLLLTGTTTRRDFVGRGVIDGRNPSQYSEEKWEARYCARIRDEITRKNCQIVRETVVPFLNARNLDLSRCKGVASPSDRDGCLLATMWLMITNDFLAYDCEKKFDFDPLLQRVCTLLSRRQEPLAAKEIQDAIPQEDGAHLYLGNEKGGFTEQAYQHPGGWTWNTKIADLDNDGFQDTFNAEGVVRTHDYGWNVFMKNMNGHGFEQKQFSYNLVDDFNLISYSLLDLGNSGVLDIVGNSSIGPVQVYLNNWTGTNKSIAISLRDYLGNRFGIGARITIRHGKKTQMREIKGSGGYQSFDPFKAYFGLGSDTRVDEITIVWRDSKRTVLKGPFNSGNHYRIERGHSPRG